MNHLTEDSVLVGLQYSYQVATLDGKIDVKIKEMYYLVAP